MGDVVVGVWVVTGVEDVGAWLVVGKVLVVPVLVVDAPLVVVAVVTLGVVTLGVVALGVVTLVFSVVVSAPVVLVEADVSLGVFPQAESVTARISAIAAMTTVSHLVFI